MKYLTIDSFNICNNYDYDSSLYPDVVEIRLIPKYHGVHLSDFITDCRNVFNEVSRYRSRIGYDLYKTIEPDPSNEDSSEFDFIIILGTKLDYESYYQSNYSKSNYYSGTFSWENVNFSTAIENVMKKIFETF